MSLQEDWYIYHSEDESNWFLQDGGPYTEEEGLEILTKDERKRETIEQRVARISYPKGAIPDKKIERRGLDLENQPRE
jgi:hypothetical protein